MFWKKEVKLVGVLVKDPICGMSVDLERAYYTELNGKKYYFCGAGCKAAFKKAQKEDQYNARPFKVRRSFKGGNCSRTSLDSFGSLGLPWSDLTFWSREESRESPRSE